MEFMKWDKTQYKIIEHQSATALKSVRGFNVSSASMGKLQCLPYFTGVKTHGPVVPNWWTPVQIRNQRGVTRAAV